MIKQAVLLIALLATVYGRSQVVVLTPAFAGQNDQVTVTFDATQGNGTLAGQSVVYAHTGVITSLSSNPNDWRHVQGNWGTDDAKVKMTSIGNNKFTLTFVISSFYGVASGEKVLKLAFVFRNVSGSLVGRATDGSDIFVPIGNGTFSILFNRPSTRSTIISNTDSLVVDAIVPSKPTPMHLWLNDSLVYEVMNDSVIHYAIPVPHPGNYTFRVVAYHNGTYEDSVRYTVRNPKVQYSPTGVVDGINYINDSTVVLQLFAPGKSFVYAIGDFSDWYADTAFDMTRTPDGSRYWTTIRKLKPGKEYRFQYQIGSEQLRIADPYADKLLDPFNDSFIQDSTLIPYPTGLTTEIVSVFKTASIPYAWQYSTGFAKPDATRLNIYELLIRDFSERHSFDAVVDSLDYLKRLGINAVELMPFNEFEGNESWGYNTSFYFAPDKYYGSKQALCHLIDECHKRGMAVIMDLVMNHSFGQSAMVRMYFDAASGKPAANNPWYNQDATHPYNVGYDFNHESVYTKTLVDTVLLYWTREFKIDGFRFDLSKGFTQKNTGTDVGAWSAYDPSRVAIWKRIYDAYRPHCSDCYLILEHFADNTEQTILSNYGFMLWGNMNAQYNEATMGYSSDLSGTSYKQFGWNDAHLVAYMESHDEERLQYKNVNFGYSNSTYNAKDTATALRRNAAAAAIFFSVPGPKMVWQFGELGYDYSINYCPDGSINTSCRTYNKPIVWEYLQSPERARLKDVYSAMMTLRNSRAFMHAKDYSTTLSGNYKVVRINGDTTRYITFANTGVLPNSQKPGFQTSGVWYNYFTGDSILINKTDTIITLQPGEYRVYTTTRLSKPFVTSVELPTSYPDFVIYPNPASHHVVVASTASGTIEVYTVSGQQVYGSNITAIEAGTTINTDTWNEGIYIVRLTTEAGTQVKKLQIDRH